MRFQESCIGKIGFQIELGPNSDVRDRVSLRYSFTVWCGDNNGDGEGSGLGSL